MLLAVCASAGTAVGGASAQVAADAAASDAARPIDILNYRVSGNTVLTQLEIETAVYPFLGPQRQTSDVELARAALEKAYRDRGFETVGVDISEQDVRGGIVLLDVAELVVGRLRVTGSRFSSLGKIKAQAPSLVEGQVPNYAAVSKDVQALNKSADRSVTPTLRAGETPGTVDVDLQVEDRLPLHASLEINDRSSGRTERLRVAASVNYANLWQLGHSLSLQGQFAPEDPSQTWVISGSYAAPIGASPFAVVAYAVHSDSDIAALGGINVLGSGDIVGLRGIYSFAQGPVRHSLTVGADYKSFKEDLVLGPQFGRTPIDYIPLTLQYGLARHGEKTDLDITAAFVFGLRGLDANEREFRLKRYQASASWAYLKVDASYSRRLPADIRAGLRVSGQLAGQPLISNEEVVLGGLDSIRGYYESQELGDDGISGQLDIESPSLAKFVGAKLNDWRFFVFGDAGYLRIHEPLGDTDGVVKDSAFLASVGVGMKLRAFDHLNVSALLARPLRHRDETITDIGDDLRGQIRAWVEF